MRKPEGSPKQPPFAMNDAKIWPVSAPRAKVLLARNTGTDFSRSSLQACSLLVCYGTYVFVAETQCLHSLHSGCPVLFPILSPCQLLAQESFVRIRTTVAASETIQFISCNSIFTYIDNKWLKMGN